MDSAWAVLKFMLAFAAVVAVARLLTVWVGRQYRSAGRNLEVVESVGLGPRRTLCLVRAGERYLLLGVTDGSIRLLDTLDKVDTLPAGRPGGLPWMRGAGRG